MKMKKIAILVGLIATASIYSEQYIIKVQNIEKDILSVESAYDQHGFDKDGINKDTGTDRDNDGYNQEGTREDVDSNLSFSFSNKLENSYTETVTQQAEQGNFNKVSGTFTFTKNEAIIQSIDSKNVIDKSTIINSPFPNGIEIIKNGSLYNNISNLGDYTDVEEVYEQVAVTYYTDWILYGTSSSATLSGDGSHSLTQSAATKPMGTTISQRNWGDRPYKYVSNEPTYYRSYQSTSTGNLMFQYRCDYYEKQKRTRYEDRLVSTTETHYTEISNVISGEIIEVNKPVKLEINIDNSGWQTVELIRPNLSSGSVNFELNGIDGRNIDFRISDNNYGVDYTTINSFNISLENKR